MAVNDTVYLARASKFLARISASIDDGERIHFTTAFSLGGSRLGSRQARPYDLCDWSSTPQKRGKPQRNGREDRKSPETRNPIVSVTPVRSSSSEHLHKCRIDTGFLL